MILKHGSIIQATIKGNDQTAVCAGWSEPFLVAHTILLEILCHGSFVEASDKKKLNN